MGGALFSGKIVLVLIVLVVGFGFSTGVFWWNHDRLKCFQTRDWSHGTWHTWFAVGRFEFRVRDFGCEQVWQFDPKEYQKDSTGNITPKLTPQP